MTLAPPAAFHRALIVGAGSGLSASLARLFAGHGLSVALAARTTEKLVPLCAETGARAFTCDAGNEASVADLFTAVEAAIGVSVRQRPLA
jgi:NADP-dependent 3-hydroxy acid dehydrogenase YdfG